MVRLKWGGAGARLPAIPRQTPKAWPSLVGHLVHNILVEGYGYWVWTSLLGGLAGLNSILMKVNIVSKEDPGSLLNGNLVQPYTLYTIVYNCIQASAHLQKMHPAGWKHYSQFWQEASFQHTMLLSPPGNPHTGLLTP